MKGFITSLALLIIITSFTENNCEKCDIQKVKAVDDHLNSLTYQIVSDFICTFDSTCKTNVEYSEWSNEILFKVLDKSPGIFFQVITKEKVDDKQLLNEIENPILDFDFQTIYDKIKTVAASPDLKQKYLNALIVAASKDGINIKK